MKNNIEKFIFLIFTIIGACIIVGGTIFLKNSIEFKNNAIETQATITDIESYRDSDGDSHHNVFVEFVVDNEVYTGELGYYSSGMYKGGTTKVYYNPENPNNFRSSSGNFASGMMIFMGIMFFAVGSMPLISSWNKKARNKKLMEIGEQIYVEFDDVIVDRSYSVNNVHPYKIICHSNQYENIRFISERIWKNPKYIIDQRNITTFLVYIDSEDPSKYYMPLEEIKEYI